jgi:hypothetical protein
MSFLPSESPQDIRLKDLSVAHSTHTITSGAKPVGLSLQSLIHNNSQNVNRVA